VTQPDIISLTQTHPNRSRQDSRKMSLRDTISVALKQGIDLHTFEFITNHRAGLKGQRNQSFNITIQQSLQNHMHSKYEIVKFDYFLVKFD